MSRPPGRLASQTAGGQRRSTVHARSSGTTGTQCLASASEPTDASHQVPLHSRQLAGSRFAAPLHFLRQAGLRVAWTPSTLSSRDRRELPLSAHRHPAPVPPEGPRPLPVHRQAGFPSTAPPPTGPAKAAPSRGTDHRASPGLRVAPGGGRRLPQAAEAAQVSQQMSPDRGPPKRTSRVSGHRDDPTLRAPRPSPEGSSRGTCLTTGRVPSPSQQADSGRFPGAALRSAASC